MRDVVRVVMESNGSFHVKLSDRMDVTPIRWGRFLAHVANTTASDCLLPSYADDDEVLAAVRCMHDGFNSEMKAILELLEMLSSPKAKDENRETEKV
jgi:hypothetical protein